jgi:branched-chain amino acid transport system ATP-binding protein
MLKVENIEVYIGEHRILRDVSLEVNQGECVAIIGANGAGKTALIRSITGLNKPRSGRILFQSQDTRQLKAHDIARLGLACVPEGRRPFREMSVLTTYAWAPMRPAPGANSRKSLDESYRPFSILAERLKQPAGTLSGGQQQMLAIGRALMSRPVLLLVDELSLGLARWWLRKFIGC